MTQTNENPLARPEPWDHVSDAYVRELVPVFEFFAREALALAELPPEARIADIATGPGTLALAAAAQGMHVTALDFSAEMLAQLRRRAAKMGLATMVELHHGDGQNLSFANQFFDGAFSMFGLIFFPDRAAGFRELRRILKLGCRAVVTSWAWQFGPFGTVMDIVRAHLPGGPGGTPQPALSYPEDYDREMTAAGFAQVRVETVTYERPFASVEDFWESVERCNPGALQTRRKLGEEKWAALRGPVLTDMRRQWGSGKMVLQLKALMGVGVA